MNKDIAVVLDTRTDVARLAGVIAELGERARVIHTGNRDEDRSPSEVLAEFGLPGPDITLALDGIGAPDRSTRVSHALKAFAAAFADDRPAAAIIMGDTDAITACAQAASYADIPLIHADAGRRSYDRATPDELNRLMTAVLADVHCAATPNNQSNLAAEGINPLRIAVTGATVVESTITSLERGDGLIAKHFPGRLVPERYILASIQHPENIGTKRALRRVLMGLIGIHTPVAFVLHSTTHEAIRRFGLTSYLDALTVIRPVDHADLLDLALSADLLIADTTPAQQECTVLKKPLLVIRRSTDHPEAIDAGFLQLVTPARDITTVANVTIADPLRSKILDATPSPYGDGSASLQIALIAARIADGASPADAITGVTESTMA
ncbi:UDP-N-acetylglucosamine 2-epimerase [Plantibacter sp. YIM 135347]|uniref:UDP-N-acetylglucosamine 2-epimerase n=1 Tax=Plantibacter sp. YIM 135347 TaxID=3423919 RepID=UPI003D33A20D